MSPRAAWRLEQLGYTAVHDYVAGKMDWLSYALPHEGTAALVGRHLDTDVATCTIDEPADTVARRHRDRTGSCIALTDTGVVMGVVTLDDLTDDQRQIADVMTFGVTTFRPSEDTAALGKRMATAKVDSIIVTSSDAVLLGVPHRHAQR